jgi:hypothetical protein
VQVRFDESITEAERFASHQRSWELWQHLSQEAGGAWGLKDDDWGRTLVQGGIPHQLRSEYVSVAVALPVLLRRHTAAVLDVCSVRGAGSASSVCFTAPYPAQNGIPSRLPRSDDSSIPVTTRLPRVAKLHGLDPGPS